MRRFLFLALWAASLLPLPGPAQAQATADQLNKLSLEALTARPTGGGGGPGYHSAYHPTYGHRRFGRTPYRYTRHYGSFHGRRYGSFRYRGVVHRSYSRTAFAPRYAAGHYRYVPHSLRKTHYRAAPAYRSPHRHR